ncbi:enamine deaminase RidA (YjgF/YER057c/UK114 family) [Arthrobacter sp. V4I6]|nr:enamine deaminase RidA (YjgF/YER057c/UK114 family) [Arthrobacter sp. V1I7]MDQ0852076.1 enamine deaminase RidA (YjgF/YER057c/UK114 family) [Arthrobacter sp. V4I6]
MANNFVYLRGQIGQDLDTRDSVGIGDVKAQAEKAVANIKLLLDGRAAASKTSSRSSSTSQTEAP